MRLLHISNWNSGRVLHREPHAADYDAMLREIADIARDARPDRICIPEKASAHSTPRSLPKRLRRSKLCIHWPSRRRHQPTCTRSPLTSTASFPSHETRRQRPAVAHAPEHEQLQFNDVSAAC